MNHNSQKQSINKKIPSIAQMKLQSSKTNNTIIQKDLEYDEVQNLKKSYQNLLNELQALKQKNAQFKNKYMRLLKDKQVIQQNYEKEKSEWYRDMVSNKFQISKFSGIIKNILNQQQLTQILANSSINQEKCCWNIVPFCFKEKCIQFPKLSRKISQNRIISNQQKRQIIITSSNPFLNSIRRPSLEANNVLKQCRKSIQKQKQKQKQKQNLNTQQKNRLKSLSIKQSPTVGSQKKVTLLPLKDKQKNIFEDLKKHNKNLKLKDFNQRRQSHKQINPKIDFVKQQ